MDLQLQTPILLLIFNRPDNTFKVFEEIRKVRPTKLFIAADGARPHKPDELAKCEETRKVAEMVDWPCEVYTLYREENLGCRRAVSSALNWFFEQVEEGIILEDDCVPAATFFVYCTELLAKYRHDERVMHITGDGLPEGIQFGDSSYFFSPFPLVWGWASWRRAWQKYDASFSTFPEFTQQNRIADVFCQVPYQKRWQNEFNQLFAQKIDSWAYHWVYTIFINNGLAIIPNQNLITNIGFGDDATHTFGESHLAAKPRIEIQKLVHPQFVLPDSRALIWHMKTYFYTKEKESPFEGFALYRGLRSIYGKIRRMLGYR